MTDISEIKTSSDRKTISCWGDRNEKAAKAVRAVWIIERIVGYIILGAFVFTIGAIAFELIQQGFSWSNLLAAGLGFMMFFLGVGLAVAIIDFFIIKPVKAIQYGRALSAVERCMPPLHSFHGKYTTWKYPFPGAITLNHSNNTLTIQSNGTNYHLLNLCQFNIIGAKVERQQTLHTETKQSGSTIFMFTNSIGYATGRRSKSKTRIEEEAFLEIAYDTGDKMPHVISIPFGRNRRAAEEWVLAIQNIHAS